MREVLVDALGGERGAFVSVGYWQTRRDCSCHLHPCREPDRFLLRLPQLVQPARRAHTDFNGVGFKIARWGNLD